MNRTAAITAAAAWALIAPQWATAQVGIDHPSSIVVYLLVVADGTRDTTIHLSNTSNSSVSARCFYVNASPQFPQLPPNPVLNPPLWQISDFELNLTSAQPTVWLVSQGRPLDNTDAPCSFTTNDYECYGAGLDPGFIPAVPLGFVGELVCVETDSTGAPVSGNHFTGAATVKDVASGDVSRYRAIGALGNENANGDDTLCLGGAVSGACPQGAEYDACPESWLIDARAEGSSIAGVPGSDLSTEITVVPCTRDFDSQIPGTVVLQYIVHNEFEQALSASSTTTCWSNQALSSINLIWDSTVLGTATARTEIRTPSASGGVMVLAEEIGTAGALRARAGVNAHVRGARANGDLIRLPPAL